jgi:hypothetical protein
MAKETKPPPKCRALLLCDDVHVDHKTQKTNIIGVVQQYVIPSRPGPTTLPCTIFLQLTEGMGSYRITLEFRDLGEDNRIAISEATEVVFPERASVRDVFFRLPVVVDHAGCYDIVAFADANEIDRQKFWVSEADQAPK